MVDADMSSIHLTAEDAAHRVGMTSGSTTATTVSPSRSPAHGSAASRTPQRSRARARQRSGRTRPRSAVPVNPSVSANASTFPTQCPLSACCCPSSR